MPLETNSEIVLIRMCSIDMYLQMTFLVDIVIKSLRMVLAVEIERKTSIGDRVVSILKSHGKGKVDPGCVDSAHA